MRFSFTSLGILVLLAFTGCSTPDATRSTTRTASGTGVASAPVPAQPVVAPPLTVLNTSTGFPSSAPQIRAASAIMIDVQTGRTLYEKNADQIRAVASTQKLLTGLLVVERGGLDGMVTVQPADTWVEPSKLGFRPGDRYSRSSLLNAIMVRSSNDAANALASDHSGSIPAFADAMNRRAREIGATNSHFRNPHGLTEPGQHSTARDVARIGWHAYRSPALRRAALLPEYTFVHNSGRRSRLVTTNKILGNSLGVTGFKTGFTNASGRCLVTTANNAGRQILLVQLGSTTQFIFNDAERMLRWEANERGGWWMASAE